MRRAMTAIYIHAVWATWDRAPLVTPDVEASIYADARDECAKLGATLLEIGGVEDHVHVLVQLPASLSVADLVKQIKGASSHLATHCLAAASVFRWQGGYAAFSISEADLPRLRSYIRNQKRHHAAGELDRVMEISDHDRSEPSLP